LCYGQSLLRTSYPDLFTAIGTTFGAADGTHFSLPDLRGRNVAGKDDMGGSAASRLSGTSITTGGATTLGGAGGSETKTLVTANLPPYTPAGTIGSMSGNAPLPARNFTTSGTSVNEVSLGSNVASSAGTLNVGLNSLSATFTGTAQGGTSTAFAIVQPTLILNYIIFAGV
jgi:microcystin-dependent protein